MRKKLYSWHKYLSLIMFLPIVLVTLTGSILVYKYEVDNILMPNVVSVKVKEERISFDKLTQKVNKAYPKYEIVGWLIPTAKNHAHRLYLIKHEQEEWDSIYINQYTGEILDEVKAHDSYLSDIIVELHANFLLEDKGVILTTIIGLIFCFISISGIFIHNKFWKNVFRLRLDKKMLIYMSDIHRFIGVTTSPIILIISITGTYWGIASIFNEEQEKSSYIINKNIYNKNISIDELYKKSQIEMKSFKVYYISYPFEKDKQISFYGKVNNQNILYNQYSNIVTFDKNTGKKINTYKISEAKFTDKFLNTFRKAHYGYYSPFTKIIWFIIGLVPLVLGITGIYLWIKRSKKRQ